MVCGPSGAGKTSVIKMLLKSFPSKLASVPALSTKEPYKSESPEGKPFTTLLASELASEVASGDAFGQCTHAGAMYAASLSDLSAAWEAGKLPVVEAPLALAAAIKAEQATLAAEQAVAEGGGGATSTGKVPTRVEVCCVYLSADVETLDVRLRKADCMEEVQLQEELALATEEAAHLPSRQQGSGSVPAVIDRVVPAGGSLQDTFMGVRELAGELWHRPREAIACQLVVDRFDWTSERGMGATELRMRTVLSAGATLELPRGRHLLRVTANHEQLHSVTFHSRTKISANEITEVMKEAEPSCTSTCLEGDYLPIPAGSCTALLKYNIKPTEPTILAASLSISGEDLRACTRLVLVDNADASGASERIVPLAKLTATELQPTTEGYTLVAISEVPSAPSRLPVRPASAVAAAAGGVPTPGSGVMSEGTWALSVTASKAVTLDPVSIARVQVWINSTS